MTRPLHLLSRHARLRPGGICPMPCGGSTSTGRNDLACIDAIDEVRGTALAYRCNTLTTDYWNPPTSANQHARQRILTVILAFALAAILVETGW